MNLRIIVLCESSQTQNTTYYNGPFYVKLEKRRKPSGDRKQIRDGLRLADQLKKRT